MPPGAGAAAAHGRPPTRAQRRTDEGHEDLLNVTGNADETVMASGSIQGPREAYSSSNSAWDNGMAIPQLLGVSP